MPPRFYDAHNHLHDSRLTLFRAQIAREVESAGIVRMVVNGACEEDWPEVLKLAQAHPWVLPSFGYHPWYVRERTADWRESLMRLLDTVPSAIGEIGLDRWRADRDEAGQEEVFLWQWRLAEEQNLPVSIHCLKAWGWLMTLLRRHPGPRVGFVLHSYGGAAELIAPLAKLGAYFSFPGSFLQDQKGRQRETFRQVPRDRLLIETDAPDQLPPESCCQFPLPCKSAESGVGLNHPANLPAIYAAAAQFFGEPLEAFAVQIEANFLRLFGGRLGAPLSDRLEVD